MKRICVLITALLLIITIFSGCSTTTTTTAASNATTAATTASNATTAAGKTLLIGVSIQGLDNPYYLQVKEGAEIFVDQLKKEGVNAELQFLECGSSDEKQVNDIKSLIARGGKDTIIYLDAINAPSVATVAEICEEAEVYWSACWSTAEGIYPMDFKYYTMFQTPDDENAGYEIAKTMFSKFETPNEGSITAIHGMLANSSSIRRQKGLNKALAEFPKVKLLDEQAGDFMASKALTITQSWLAKYDDTTLDGIWTCNDDETLGVIEALKAKKFNGKILTCGVDGIPDAIAAIESGDIVASYASNGWQQIFYGLAYPYAAYKGEIDTTKLDAGHRMFFTAGVLITTDNIKEYKAKYNKEALAPTFDRTKLDSIIVRPLNIGE